eukprot:5676904-Pyramimonas_sp.AAC.1
MGRGRGRPRKLLDAEVERLPVIGLDLAFFNGEAADAAGAGPRAEDGHGQGEEVVLVVADADTGAMGSAPKPDRRADPLHGGSRGGVYQACFFFFHQKVILKVRPR